jgi:predicted patatin/cPLA2 family phospholipase
LIQWRYRRYPSLVQAAATRHLRYNAALELIEREEKRGTVLVIQPRTPVAIGRLEKNAARLRRLYQDGYDDTKKILLALKSFIN